MDFQAGCDGSGHANEAEVLDDDGVDPGCLQEAQLVGRLFQLAGEDECVHGHEPSHSMLMKEFHQTGQVIV